jgi:DNA-binding MarR family transcriptional regulator
MSHDFEDSLLPGQNIGCALSRARSLLTADMDLALAGTGTGVTSSQVGTVLLLSRGMAHSPAELSKQLAADPGYITRVVDRLERQGLVHRARNCHDRRVVDLTLTEVGQDAAARIEAILPVVMNRRLSRFTPGEFATLCSLLGKLLDE